MFKSKSFIFLTGFFIGAAQGLANSPVVPLNTFLRPSIDITKKQASLRDETGKELTFEMQADLFFAGRDMSIFDPEENNFWQKPSKLVPALDLNTRKIRDEIIAKGGVEHVDYVGGNRELGIFSIFVQPKGSTDRFGLTLGTSIHTSLVRAALLRKLGFYQESPIFFEEIKVEFGSAEKKKEFIENAFCKLDDRATATCIPIDPWISKDESRPRTEPFLIDDGGTSLKIRSAYLEKFNPAIPSLIDGLTPTNVANVNAFGAHRGFRGLSVPFAISELGESLNRVEKESVRLVDGNAYMLFNFASDFGNTDHFDMRWIARKMAKLNVDDWNQIIDAGQYPDKCLNQMVYNSLVGRFENMLSVLNVNTIPHQKNITWISVDSNVLGRVDHNYNCGDLVKNGNLTREFVKGSPIRFSHGLRDSPWGKGDLLRYALLKVQSSLLQTGLSELAKKVLTKKESAGKARIAGNQVLSEFTENTLQGIVDGSRIINTGTLMGSEAPVQMVDNLTIGLGYSHMKLKQLAPDVIRGFSGRIQAKREFTYVKPIGSMKEAQETSVLSVLENPSKLKDLADVLKPENGGNISEFLNKMKKNEVFFITDVIALEGSYGLSYGLAAIKMLGRSITPVISLSLNGSVAVIGQTMFLRTEEGLQVIIRKLDPSKNRIVTTGFNVSANALFEFFAFNFKKTKGVYTSDVYNLDYDSELMSTICPRVFALMDEYKNDPKYSEVVCGENQQNLEEIEDDEIRTKAIEAAHAMKRLEKSVLTAMLDLIFDSSTRVLEADKSMRHRKFEVTNVVKTTEKAVKMFWNRQMMVSENQVISFFRPILKDNSVNPGQPIKIAVSTRGDLRGDDPVGFSLNFLDALMKEKWGDKAIALSQNAMNPSGMPKGSAEWRIAETQSEITSIGGAKGGKMPSMATLRYVWGGWNIKQAELNELISKVNQRIPNYILKTVKLDPLKDGPQVPSDNEIVKLVPDGVFDRVGKIDFYRLIVSVKIEQGGLHNLKKLFISPDIHVPSENASHEEKRGFLWRFFNKVNQKITGDYRAEDKVIFDKLVDIYGREQYMAECTNDAMNTEGPTPMIQATFAGTDYKCLSKWVERLIVVARKFQENNIERATEAYTEILYILDDKLPLPTLLDVIGIQNYRYGANVFGFRAQDENAVDAAWQGPFFGEPANADDYENSLTGFLAKKARISPLVINRSQMQF